MSLSPGRCWILGHSGRHHFFETTSPTSERTLLYLFLFVFNECQNKLICQAVRFRLETLTESLVRNICYERTVDGLGPKSGPSQGWAGRAGGRQLSDFQQP
jgi:hypothetical protein